MASRPTLRRFLGKRQGPSLASLLAMTARSLVRDGPSETWKRMRSYWRTVGGARSTDDIELREGRGVLFVSGCPGHPRRYRCENPHDALRARGVDCEIVDHPAVDYAAVLPCFQLFVLHRVPWTTELADFCRDAKKLGKPVVFDTDDLDFEPSLAEHLDAVQQKTELGRELYRESMADQRRALELVEHVFVSTPVLASHIERELPGKSCAVVRNAASNELVALSSAVANEAGDPRPTIGYFSGTPTHDRDLAVIAGPIRAALDAVPELRLLLVGPVRMPDALVDVSARVELHAAVEWTELPRLLRRAHLHLAPVEPNPFTEAKSELKFFEAGLVARPCIAAAAGAYRDCVRDGANGWLCASAAEWRQKLIEAASDPAALEACGRQARADALAGYTMDVRGEQWLGLLAQLGFSATASR